jgi:ElaB/YqjD/DUF883 family membrane-anchored ribosome-binding protein
VAEILTALLTYGPLGIFCAVLWLAYTKKDEQVESLNKKIQEILENHAKSLEDLRKAHAEREKEVANMLQSYGNSVVTAVDQSHELAERLWSIRK